MMTKKSINNLVNKLTKITHLDQNKIQINYLFGYYSLNYDNVVFALVYEDKLYLKGNEHYHNLIEALNLTQIIMDNFGMAKALDYYEINNELWNNQNQLKELTELTIHHALDEHKKQLKMKESRLKDLPNISISLERLLFKSGVPDVNTFSEIGPYEAFYRLLNQSPHISNNILYILYCALKKVHVHTLTQEHRQKIFQTYQKYLDNC